MPVFVAAYHLVRSAVLTASQKGQREEYGPALNHMTSINTDGGAVLHGNLTTGGGIFVGRDQITNMGFSAQDVARIVEQLQHTPISEPLDAALYTEPVIVAAPDKFIGRQLLLDEIEQRLHGGIHVLLTGMGGIGKTALAAALANRHIYNKNGFVVWMRGGDKTAATLFEALARQVQKSGVSLPDSEIQKVVGDAKAKIVYDGLAKSPISLIVLDDVRNGNTLHEFKDAIPSNVHLLATSRYHFSSLDRYEVGDLLPNEAVELLSYHSKRSLQHYDASTQELCRVLGYHPYALEIAGAVLNIDEKTPAQLLKRIGSAPHTVISPDADDYDQGKSAGGSSIRSLLDDSFSLLDVNTKLVFCGFGLLFVPGVSATFLALITGTTPDLLEDALDKLVRRSLVKRNAQLNYYTIHNLTFSYIREKADQSKFSPNAIFVAAETYTLKYVQNFDQLELDLPNLLGVARVAKEQLQLYILSMLTIGGYPDAHPPSYFDDHGHTLEFLEQLDQVIKTARQIDLVQPTTLHYLLSKRGNAYVDRGDLENALSYYRSALDLAPNANRRAMLFAVCGRIYSMQGNDSQATSFLDQGYRLATAEQDDHVLAYVLEQQSFVAGLKQDFEAARRFASEAVETNRRLGDESSLGFALINLGAAEMELSIEKTFHYLNEVIAIATHLQNDELLAHALKASGEIYHARLDFKQAQEHFQRARKIYQQLGKVDLESETLNLMLKYGYLHLEESKS